MTTTTSLSNTSDTGKWIKRGLVRSAAITLLGAMTALLGACGGGGAATTGPASGGSTPTLAVLPTAATAYGNVAVTFTVSGGKPPYSVVSSNTSLIPVPAPIGSDGKLTVTPRTPAVDTDVVLTFKDSSTTATTVTSTANLKASTLSSSLTITPSSVGAQCGGICSGGNGVASVQSVIAGIPGQGRNIRFDAFQGDYGFVTPGNSVNDPTVSSITITTDNQGIARIVIRAKNGAPSQSAIIQVVDVLSGEVRRFVFQISQVTATTEILINPAKFDWTSPFKDACVVGGISNHYVSGGVPPYTVSASSPDFAILAPSVLVNGVPVVTIAKDGDAVQVITTGNVCSTTGIPFIVRDATARTATFTVSNSIGPPTGPSAGVGAGSIPAPTITPATLGPLACGASDSAFVVQNSTVSTTLTPTSLQPNRVSALISNGILTVTRLANSVGGVSSVLVRVSNGASFTDVPVSLSGVAPFGCGANAGAGAITVAGSSSITVASGTQVAQTIAGGSAPYSIVSSNSGIASVAPLGTSGFVVTGVAVGTTFVTITDATGAATTVVVTVTAGTPISFSPGNSGTAAVTNGTTGTFGLTGGSGAYSISSISSVTPGRVAATINGNVLSVSAVAGAAQAPAGTIVVTDTAGGTFTITVNIL